MEVSKGVALFFKDQLIGGHNGDMAEKPNNPVLSGLLKAHGVVNYKDTELVAFLRATADILEDQ